MNNATGGAKVQLSGTKILLVEDCPDQQRLLYHYLRNAQADVALECNGEAAVDSVAKASQKGTQFDAVVMDLVLQQMDGICATEQILRISPAVAVVGLTANGSDAVETAWRRAGCIAYLTKPVTKDALTKVLAEGISMMRIDNEIRRGLIASRPLTEL
ncbi:MAG: response regulator [Pirellulaceae bacterium]